MEYLNIWKFLGGRKFIALLIATGLLIAKVITQDIWLYVTLVWLGVEGGADIIIKAIKSKKEK